MLRTSNDSTTNKAGIGSAENPLFHPTPEMSANFFSRRDLGLARVSIHLFQKLTGLSTALNKE
jgi:hypothetical protein